MGKSNENQYDYIVVGAGSAGSVVASRLSENQDISVLLLEAGGTDIHPNVQNPVKWPTLFYGDLDWGYKTVPQRHCHNRVDHCPRGKMLGGCHSHNANAWVHGHHTDFDNWADQGNPGWDFNSISPILRKIEDWQGQQSALRGSGGPMYVSPPVDPNPIASAFVESGQAAGAPVMNDYNSGTMEGTSFFNMTIKNGKRFSVVNAYLQPAMSNSNLTTLTNAETFQLIIENNCCTGIKYHHDGELKIAHAAQEIILSAGVIGSPRLLLLSGIGPEQDLQQLNIPLIIDLPGVGKNLQDHPLLGGIVYECKGHLPEARNNGAESTMWWKSDSSLSGPDIQPVILEFPFTTPELADRLPHQHCYTIAPSVVRPASRGNVKLASSDPGDHPLIDVNFLQCDADINALLFAIELCRDMGASSAFSEFNKREIMPGNLNRTDMIEFIRTSVSTYFHPTSTCKMGNDKLSVVDSNLKVHGIKGLRIADASIMPTVTSGNTNAPAVMIGEKAATMILSE